MKAVGYIRVSTDDQAEKGISLDAQRAKLEGYATAKDMTLVEIIEDAGLSAKTMNRPGMQRVLKLAEAGDVDAVLVVKLDRMFRNTVDALNTTTAFDKWGVSFHSVHETIDTKSAMGRFFFTITAGFADLERCVIAERTRDALRHKRRKGEKTGGDVPYGFTAQDGRLTESPHEQEAIALMQDLRAKGYTFREIAADLEREGYAPRRGGRHWHPQSVKRILERAAA